MRCDVVEGFEAEGRVDAVLHFALPADYLRHPLATLRVGSEGTRKALELADVKGARFVLASTSEAFSARPTARPPHNGSSWMAPSHGPVTGAEQAHT